MALVRVGGAGLWWPNAPLQLSSPNSASSTAMTTSAHKIAFIGRVWTATPYASTKNLQSVEFLTGAITAGTATLRVSAQGVATGTTTPIQPTGTILGGTNNALVTVATSGLSSTTWTALGNFAEVAPVSYGQSLAIVLDYSSFTSGASVTVNGLSTGAAAHMPVVSFFTAAWASLSSVHPNVILNFDDATVGTLDSSFPYKSLTTLTYNSGTNPNENALAFQVPFSGTVDGVWAILGFNVNTNTLAAVIEDSAGSTVGSGTTTVSSFEGINIAGSLRPIFIPLPETTLTINTQYYLSIKPTAASSINAQYFDVNAASHLGVHPGGTNWNYATRNGGAWTTTTTRKLFAGLRFSQLDSGGGGTSAGPFSRIRTGM